MEEKTVVAPTGIQTRTQERPPINPIITVIKLRTKPVHYTLLHNKKFIGVANCSYYCKFYR
jgi:hypothetical protein